METVTQEIAAINRAGCAMAKRLGGVFVADPKKQAVFRLYLEQQGA